MSNWYIAGLFDQTKLIEYSQNDAFFYCNKWRPELFNPTRNIEGYSRGILLYQYNQQITYEPYKYLVIEPSKEMKILLIRHGADP